MAKDSTKDKAAKAKAKDRERAAKAKERERAARQREKDKAAKRKAKDQAAKQKEKDAAKQKAKDKAAKQKAKAAKQKAKGGKDRAAKAKRTAATRTSPATTTAVTGESVAAAGDDTDEHTRTAESATGRDDELMEQPEPVDSAEPEPVDSAEPEPLDAQPASARTASPRRGRSARTTSAVGPLPQNDKTIRPVGYLADALGREDAVTRTTQRETLAASYTTRDHDIIRAWAQSRGGRPADARGTGRPGRPAGVLRIEFPDGPGDDSGLEEIDWDSYFTTFDDSDVDFLYQERLRTGDISRFHKIVRADA